MTIKSASEVKPGDKLESSRGVITIVRAHNLGYVTSMIGTISGKLTPWFHHDSMDQFKIITVH